MGKVELSLTCRIVWPRLAALFVCLASGLPAVADAIVPVGIIGNSGESGTGLFLVRGMKSRFDSSGVAIDERLTPWVGTGSSITRIGLDGRVLERFALVPDGSTVNGTTFAISQGRLFFFGRLADGRYSLFSLSLTRPGAIAEPVMPNLPPTVQFRGPPRLAPQTWNAQLVIAFQGSSKSISVVAYAMDTRQWTAIAELPGEALEAVAVWKSQIIIGGRVSSSNEAFSPGVAFLGGSGTWRTYPVIPLVATPTTFSGRISAAGDALWDVTAAFGFLARMDGNFARNPGVVTNWAHELDQSTQVLAINQPATTLQALLVATNAPGVLFLGEWDLGRKQFRLTRRFGSLATITSLGLSDDDWITVGTGRNQLWWRWDDESTSVPAKTDMSTAESTGFFLTGRYFAFGSIARRSTDQDGPRNVPLIFSPVRSARNLADRPTDGQPLAGVAMPTSAALLTRPDGNSTLYVVDSTSRAILKVPISRQTLRPNQKGIQPLALLGVTLSSPTDIVALSEQQIIIADAGRIVMLVADGEMYRPKWMWDNSSAPGGKLGTRLHIAAAGHGILVSDTDRHRVIWFDWKEARVLAQFGVTDEAGDDLMHLNHPTFVAASESRAVVADADNQRIVRIELKE